jgi:hypothetical protein
VALFFHLNHEIKDFMEDRTYRDERSVSEIHAIKTSKALDNLLIWAAKEDFGFEKEKLGCTVLNPSDRIINDQLENISSQDPGQVLEMMFYAGFTSGFNKVIVVTASFEGIENTIKEAFDELEKVKVVLGPTANGRFYLYGMKDFNREIFYGKPWDSPFLNYQLLYDLSRKRLPFQLLRFLEMDGVTGAA